MLITIMESASKLNPGSYLSKLVKERNIKLANSVNQIVNKQLK
jgi:hypothetical protein